MVGVMVRVLVVILDEVSIFWVTVVVLVMSECVVDVLIIGAKFNVVLVTVGRVAVFCVFVIVRVFVV